MTRRGMMTERVDTSVPSSSSRARTDRPGVIKRSLTIAGHATSISLEEPFWRCLKTCADERHMSVAALVHEIDAKRGAINLSSALRLHVLDVLMVRTEGASPAKNG